MSTSSPIPFYWHPAVAAHDERTDHVVMAPQRLTHAAEKLRHLPMLSHQVPRLATLAEVYRVHEPHYVDEVALSQELLDGEVVALDFETTLNNRSWLAFMASAGGVCEGVERILAGDTQYAVNLGYPGHHAHRSNGHGFCVINTTAIAALHALTLCEERVVVMDFDTHAADGTIDIVRNHGDRILFAETYQKGFPGSFLGGSKPGNLHRYKCERGSNFVTAWTSLLHTIETYSPALIVVSAGFDGHHEDPLSDMKLSDGHYIWLARELRATGIPCLINVEGGYNVETTSRCLTHFLDTLTQ